MAKSEDPAATEIHPREPDAVVSPPEHAKDFRASYKPMVFAYEVQPSRETEPVSGLLDRAQALGNIETALFGSGYFNEAGRPRDRGVRY